MGSFRPTPEIIEQTDSFNSYIIKKDYHNEYCFQNIGFKDTSFIYVFVKLLSGKLKITHRNNIPAYQKMIKNINDISQLSQFIDENVLAYVKDINWLC